MEPIMRIQFKDGDVTIDYAHYDAQQVQHYVMDYVAQLLSGTPAVEKIIELYGDIELIFLVAEYYQRHQNLIGFAFPEGYEVPDFLIRVVAEGEEENYMIYRIKITCDEPVAVDLIVAISAGLFLGVSGDNIAFTHFAVHEMIADYIDAAYKGDEDDEDCDPACA